MPRVWTAFILLVLSAGIARAQQSACLERTIPVSISSNDGSPAPELAVADLAATYDKKSVTVKSVELEKTSPRLILLIDTSGSMRWRIGATIDVAEGVLYELPANVEAGLAFFAGDTTPVTPPALDRRTLILELESLRRNPGADRGRTALWSALTESAKMFKEPRPGDSIYLISDAGENQSVANRKSVEMAFGTSGIRLFAFILSTGISPANPGQLEGPTGVQSLVKSSGGTAVVEPSISPYYRARLVLADKNGKPTYLGESLARQVAQLVHFYWVEVTLPDRVEKPNGWKLRFTKSLRDNFNLSYPMTLWPCF